LCVRKPVVGSKAIIVRRTVVQTLNHGLLVHTGR
jgi:hypothetical protein